MEIKSLSLKNKNNANIFLALTSKGEFSLHSEAIVKNGIKVGEVDDAVFDSALMQSNILIATERAMKYISTKLKTEHQIKDYLYKQGYNSQVVNPVVQKLNDYNLINDFQFAKSYMVSNKNFSANKLKQKLISFGVKQGAIDEILYEVDDFPACQKSAQKFLKNKPLDAATIQKLTRHLLSQGYSFDTIKTVLHTLQIEYEE